MTPASPWPSIPDAEDSPFYYSSLVGVGALFAAHTHELAGILPPGLAPAVLGGLTYAGISYQRYHASYPTGDAVINELELSILAVPADQSYGPLEVEDFVGGNEQSKQIGFFPVHVACDHDAAITAGREIFGEPKFKARFAIGTPSWNTHRLRNWSITVADTDPVLSLSMPAVPDGLLAAVSPITTYGIREDRVIASRWQITTPVLGARAEHLSQCRVTVTDPSHPLGHAASTLVDLAAPAAMWQHLSPPVAVRYRPFYLDRPAVRS